MQIQTRSTSELRPNPDNPRTITDSALKKLVASLRAAPWMLEARPLIVDENDIVLGGNMRLKACVDAGLTHVPTIKLTHLTEEQKREFIIKDNLAFGEWDYQALSLDWNIELLQDWGLDFSLPQAKPTLDDTTVIEAPKTTEVLEGDIFKIGEHFLACGDSTNVQLVKHVLALDPCDFIFTDPMYDMKTSELIALIESLAINHLLLMATMRQCAEFINGSSFEFRFDLILNQKIPSSTLNKRVPYYLHKNVIYMNNYADSIFHCDNAKGEFGEASYYPSIIESAKNTQSDHGLEKNPEGIKKMLSGFSFHRVLDLFAGSGTTMLAAHILGKRATCFEINPLYCQIILDRMRKHAPELPVEKLYS